MNHKSTLSVLLAGILWGILSIFVRRLSAAGLDAMEISAVRMMVAAPCFTLLLAVVDRDRLRVRLRDLWMFLGTGIVSVVLFNYCYFSTILNSQASVAVVLLYTSPVFVMLLSALFFKEEITPGKLGALALTLAGCVLVAGILGGSYTISFGVLVTGLASGLFYALYTIFGRVALERYDTMTVTVYTFLFGLAGSLVLSRPGHVVSTLAGTPSLAIWYLGIGIIGTILPYFFYTWGLQRMESGRAAILATIEPLVGAILGIAAYHESHDAAKLAGIAMILGAIVVLNLQPGKGAAK